MQARELAQQLDRLRGRLGEVRARGRRSAARGSTPAARARARSARARKASTSPVDVRVEVGVLQPFARRGARCASRTSAAPVSRADAPRARVAQAADVVDDPRAGGDRGARDGGLVGVDRDDRPELARDPLDSGTTRSISSSSSTGGRPVDADSPPTSRMSAPVGEQLARRARSCASRRRVQAAVAEGVGGGVDDAHQPAGARRARAPARRAAGGARGGSASGVTGRGVASAAASGAPRRRDDPLGARLLARSAASSRCQALLVPAELAREDVADRRTAAARRPPPGAARRSARGRRAAPGGCAVSSTSPMLRACSWRAARATSASRSGSPGRSAGPARRARRRAPSTSWAAWP